MTTAVRVLGLDRAKWERAGPGSVGPATVLAVAASVVIAFNRFGGLVFDAPRSFVRLTLIGVWGWLGLSLAIWLLATRVLLVANSAGDSVPTPSVQHTLAIVGLAHIPLLALGLVIFAAAGVLQILGPGFVAAVFVFGFWFPAILAVAARHTFDLSLARAMAVVAVPYSLWLVVVGRHLLGQVQHLL